MGLSPAVNDPAVESNHTAQVPASVCIILYEGLSYLQLEEFQFFLCCLRVVKRSSPACWVSRRFYRQNLTQGSPSSDHSNQWVAVIIPRLYKPVCTWSIGRLLMFAFRFSEEKLSDPSTGGCSTRRGTHSTITLTIPLYEANSRALSRRLVLHLTLKSI